MWETQLKITYNDYQLDREREKQLKDEVEILGAVYMRRVVPSSRDKILCSVIARA